MQHYNLYRYDAGAAQAAPAPAGPATPGQAAAPGDDPEGPVLGAGAVPDAGSGEVLRGRGAAAWPGVAGPAGAGAAWAAPASYR